MRRAVARGRVFPQSYSTDRRYGRLSLKAIGLFPLMWANADDQGRLCGDPEEVKYACCPNIDHITKTDIPGILQELQTNGLITVYETPKSSAIQILDWWDIQKPQWAWPSDYPAPGGWQDRLRYKSDAKTVIAQNWPPSPETQKGAQVSEDKFPGEDTDMAHLRAKGGSPGTENHAQVNLLETACKKTLDGADPRPSPPLETEKETERGKRKRNSPEDSGESKKGAQVSTQVAKKPPGPLGEDRKTVFAGLKERRGYNSPQAGAEAKAITWMLKQSYSVADILSAYDQLKQDVFWRNKLLNMQSVKAQIGEIFRERRQHEQREPEGWESPAHQSDSVQDYQRRAEDAGLTVIISGEDDEAGDENGGV